MRDKYFRFSDIEEKVHKSLLSATSIEQLMEMTGLRSLDKKKPRKLFEEYFGVDLRKLMAERREQVKIEKKLKEYNSIVVCTHCGKKFKFSDHPSNNKQKHNFCSDECRNKYIASHVTTKVVKCNRCGIDVMVDARTPKSSVLCSCCRKIVEDEKARNKYGEDYALKLKRKQQRELNREKRSKPSFCKSCGKELPYGKSFCNNHCYSNFMFEQWIAEWKLGKHNGKRGNGGISGYIRRYLLKKYNYKCSRCGWHEVNPTTGKIPLEVEHIDGNFRNNKEENLTILCPNCHSLTPTYRSLNKGHGRPCRSSYSSDSET